MFKKTVIILYILFMITSAFLSIPVHDLHPDEAHYWVWAQNLDLSYYDNAPMVAYVVRVFTTTFGKNQIAMRLPAWLGYCFIIGLAYFFGKRVFGNKRTGIIAAILIAAIPIYQGAMLITSDVTNVFFSALTIVFAYFAIEENRKLSWLWAGICFGLAIMSKYQAVLIGGSIFLMLLFRKDKRHFLKSPFPYMAALVSLLIFTPVLVWNYQRHWLSFCFQLQHGLGSHTSFQFSHLLNFLASQALAFSPLVFIILLYFLGKFCLHERLRTSQNNFLLFSSLPVLLFFASTSLKKTVDLQWTIVAIFPAVIFIAGQIENSFQVSDGVHKKLWIGYLGTTIIISILLISFVHYPEFYMEKLHLSLKPNAIITNRVYGWSEMGKYTDSILRREFPSKPVPVFVPTYQIGGVVSYYTKNKKIAVLAAPLVRRNQFDEYTLKRIMKFNGREGLLISKSYPIQSELFPHFYQSCKLMGVYRRIRFKNVLDSYYFYKVVGIRGPEIISGIESKPLF